MKTVNLQKQKGRTLPAETELVQVDQYLTYLNRKPHLSVGTIRRLHAKLRKCRS